MNDNIIQSHLNKARKDKYQITISLPTIFKTVHDAVGGDGGLNQDSIQFAIFSAAIPPVSIPAVQLHYGGQNINISSHDRPAYPPMNVQFFVDNEYDNYFALWLWLAMLNDPQTGLYRGASVQDMIRNPTHPNYRDYASRIEITTLDEYNKPKMSFTFNNSFITQLDGFDMDSRSADDISCGFQFAYDKMLVARF